MSVVYQIKREVMSHEDDLLGEDFWSGIDFTNVLKRISRMFPEAIEDVLEMLLFVIGTIAIIIIIVYVKTMPSNNKKS